MPLGVHEVIVFLAGQTSAPVSVSLFCGPGYYAEPGARCMGCPQGGVCAGGGAMPVADAGWYETGKAVFEPCAPASACLGGARSPCATGYVEIHCRACAYAFYRLNENCVPCPSFTLLYIFLFVLVVGLVISAAFWLNKKRVNVSALSIGIDFMQVVAMFS